MSGVAPPAPAWPPSSVVAAGAGTGVATERASNWATSTTSRLSLASPLAFLAAYCRRVLDSDYLLRELVRDADVEWGRLMGERPYFEKEGAPRHPDDPYTVESVRNALSGVLEQLASVER